MKHTDEVTRLDVALLDYILQRRWVNIGYVILRHMISTPVMNNWSFPLVALLPRFFDTFGLLLINQLLSQLSNWGMRPFLIWGLIGRMDNRLRLLTSKIDLTGLLLLTIVWLMISFLPIKCRISLHHRSFRLDILLQKHML